MEWIGYYVIQKQKANISLATGLRQASSSEFACPFLIFDPFDTTKSGKRLKKK
jgi:hypothetical protein